MINELSLNQTARDTLMVRESLIGGGGKLLRTCRKASIRRRIGRCDGTCHHNFTARMSNARQFGTVYCPFGVIVTCKICGASKRGLEELRRYYPDLFPQPNVEGALEMPTF